MASCVCKVLERMINMRISWWLENNQKFSETQYGFRRNKGCTDNLAILSTEIIKAFEERNRYRPYSLSLKVHTTTSTAALGWIDSRQVGFSGNLLAFIFNLVSARELEANYGWLDLKDWTYKGLPQGSVLSPTLCIVCSVRTSQITYCVCATNTNRLLLFRGNSRCLL
jgi:potassium voltage-gated channel Eag-related subfamily H protein 8